MHRVSQAERLSERETLNEERDPCAERQLETQREKLKGVSETESRRHGERLGHVEKHKLQRERDRRRKKEGDVRHRSTYKSYLSVKLRVRLSA